MIVIRIKGGLGNQLFQYASARGIAASSGHTLKIDCQTGFPRDTYRRSYRLNHFRVPQAYASNAEIWWSRALTWRRWRAFRNFESAAMLQRGEFFLPELARVPGGRSVYLEAYLQSPQYFSCIEAELRSELSPEADSEPLRARLRVIQGRDAVSVHVRRRDYARLLPAGYYLQAVELIRARVGHREYFVFGDDLDWAAQELHWLEPKTLVRNDSPNDDVADLALMASCKHHVMANSTFSWWAAWLSGIKDGIVVAPGRGWTEIGVPPKDLFLPGWKVI